MIIRSANKNDLPEITHMAGEMAELHYRIDPYYKPGSQYKNLEENLAEELKDKNSLFLVAELDSKIVGYFRGSIEKSPEYISAKKIGVVYDLFIEPESRQKGVGMKFMETALAWFNEKAVKNIELSVNVRNQPAIKFWKKFGFMEYKYRMRLNLPSKK